MPASPRMTSTALWPARTAPSRPSSSSRSLVRPMNPGARVADMPATVTDVTANPGLARQTAHGDAAVAQVLGDRGRQLLGGDDRAAVAQVARRVPVEQRGAVRGGVDDGVDPAERRDRLAEQPLDVEVVAEV